MRIITDYIIVQWKEVEDFIRKGWQPYGSPFYNPHMSIQNTCQAVVKYKEEDEFDEDELDDGFLDYDLRG